MLLKLLKIAALAFACLLLAGAVQAQSDTGQKDYKRSYELGATEGFCELVNYGVKELGLGVPMTPDKMDIFLPFAEKAAERHTVKLYREPDLIDTDLFTTGIAKGRDVLLIYNGATLTKYLDLKADRIRLEEEGAYHGKAREEIARRFGRLLSYTPRTINNQLILHTDYRNMYNFGIQASNLELFYTDLDKATAFYTQLLGLPLVKETPHSRVVKMASHSYLTLTDASAAPDYANEAKTVAMAFVTQQPEEWFNYFQEQAYPIKHKFRAIEGRPYHSFVIEDPEGYLIEFERFNQHPQNEDLIPLLKNNTALELETKSTKKLTINSSITWLYYKNLLEMQHFYEDVLGLEMIVDQGWVKIYQSSKTGFIGLVDEKRGMHNFTKKKAVILSFILDDPMAWEAYVKKNETFPLLSKPKKGIQGIDPEGYTMHFLKGHSDR